MNQEPYSQYWCHLGEFTKGPQPCGCGKANCDSRENHIAKATGTMSRLPLYRPMPYSTQDFQAFWLRGGLVR